MDARPGRTTSMLGEADAHSDLDLSQRVTTLETALGDAEREGKAIGRLKRLEDDAVALAVRVEAHEAAVGEMGADGALAGRVATLEGDVGALVSHVGGLRTGVDGLQDWQVDHVDPTLGRLSSGPGRTAHARRDGAHAGDIDRR